MGEIILREELPLEEKKLDNALIEVANKMLTMEQADCPLIHHFGPGIYMREVLLPKDTLAIGHYHKTEHTNLLLKGELTLLNSDGTTSRLKAPLMRVSRAGRKCVYTHEESSWINVYATDKTNIAEIEEEFLDKTGITESEQNDLLRTIDIGSYNEWLDHVGLTEQEARIITENKKDQIPFPYGSYGVMVDKSNIEGFGLFATIEYNEGDVIAPARLGKMRTPAGRYTNHSIHPNAIMLRDNKDDIYLVATKNIKGMSGGKPVEEITVNYFDVVKLHMKEK